MCALGTLPKGEGFSHPVGKCYASIVDDEKMAFEQQNKYPTAQAKKSATAIVAAFADMSGQR